MDLTWLYQGFQDPNLRSYLIGILSGIGGSLITVSVTSHFQRKNLEFNTLTRIFDLLGDEKHREARRCVYHAFEEYVKGSEPNMEYFEVISDKTEIVRSDFDQIGILIYKKIKLEDLKKKNQDKYIFGKWWSKGYIPKEIFFEAYAGAVVNSWLALEHFVEYKRRTEYSEKRFMLFFKCLFYDAQSFHENRGKSKIQNLQVTHKDKLDKWLTKIKNDSQR